MSKRNDVIFNLTSKVLSDADDEEADVISGERMSRSQEESELTEPNMADSDSVPSCVSLLLCLRSSLFLCLSLPLSLAFGLPREEAEAVMERVARAGRSLRGFFLLAMASGEPLVDTRRL